MNIAIDYPNPKSNRRPNRLPMKVARWPALGNARESSSIWGTALRWTFDIVAPTTPTSVRLLLRLGASRIFSTDRTALLPDCPCGTAKCDRQIDESGNASGAIFGYRGLVREIWQRIRREIVERTGPDSGDRRAYLQNDSAKVPPEGTQVHENLIWNGFARWSGLYEFPVVSSRSENCFPKR